MMFTIILLSICIHYIDSVSVRKGDDITTVELKNDERPITGECYIENQELNQKKLFHKNIIQNIYIYNTSE